VVEVFYSDLSCEIVDFPESNPNDMFSSLMKLKSLEDEIGVYPGHAYNGDMTTIGTERREGVLRFNQLQEFLISMGIHDH
jgi:glyoxylase-like metal-dependent hydrolase (beta-lactamase superfamily II)